MISANFSPRFARIRPGARELIPLLHEGASIYAGRGSAACGRIRARILATFGEVGLPATALPFVIEALRTELNPEIVAGAAIAARGLAGSDGDLARALVQALDNLHGRDAPVACSATRENPPHCWRFWPRCAGNRPSRRTWSMRSGSFMIDIHPAGAFGYAAPLSRRSPSWQLARAGRRWHSMKPRR